MNKQLNLSPSEMQAIVKKHDPSAIKAMQDFVGGKLPIDAFKNKFDNDPSIKATLSQGDVDFLSGCRWATISGQAIVWQHICWFLEDYDYSYEPYTYYKDRSAFLIGIQPDWLDITDEDFLENEIVLKAPEGLSKIKKEVWCKARLKELFRYDNRPPRWVQSPEWPIVNGKPLVFKNQTRVKKDDERVWYYFYDPDTGKGTVVEQCY